MVNFSSLPFSFFIFILYFDDIIKYKVFRKRINMQQLLIVDGYNLIFSEFSIFNKKVKNNKKVNLSDARETLLGVLSNYASYKGMLLLVVFDAYKVKSGVENIYDYDRNTSVIYTAKNETADTVIERTVHELKDRYEIKVATSDKSQQDYILSQGATRFSSREIWIDIMETDQKLFNKYIKKKRSNEPLMKTMNHKTVKVLERIRRGLQEDE
jgi:predicted RNA-binding protein with PIN domain